MQKYLKEINISFDQKQCFEMTIMRLCYVSLIPTPFEALQEINKTQASQQKTETNPQEILRKNNVLHTVENNQNNSRKNRATRNG